MDLKEALNVIGLPKTASTDDFKIKYRELAKKYHPDIYKEDPEKFKKINEAYQLIQEYKENPDKFDRPPAPAQSPFRRSPFGGSPFGDISFEDIFTNVTPEQQPQKNFSYPPLNTTVNISFKESVLGENKELHYKKYIKCDGCNGKGSEAIGNGCQSCNGFGRIVSNNKGMIFTKVCTKCYGKDTKVKSCTLCNSVGVKEIEVNVTVHIPPGTINGSTLRLKGGGHYVGGNIFGDAYADVYVNVNVAAQEGLSLEGKDVLSSVKLSLLEALTGCTKEINTIFDIRKVEIPILSKNKDEIRIPGCGVVSAGGVQRVILDIDYPSDTGDLINYLKGKEI